MNRLWLVAVLFFVVAACSGGSNDEGTSGGDYTLEAILEANTSWPYEVVGVLDIVEAGGYDDSDYPTWAVGSIVPDGEEWGVSIEIQGNVVSRARINIDSGKPVRAWLEAPKREYGIDTYPVSRIEAL
jgi:hypothetical protein